MFDKVAIIGVGLIGGSMGMAIKRRRLARKVVGVARRNSSISQAIRMDAIDAGTQRISEALEDADLIVFAVPAASAPMLLKQNMKKIKKGALITDVCSTKREIAQAIEGFLPDDASFVGAHPLAGSQMSGVRYARKDLFEGSTCIVTKTKRTDPEAIKRVASLWRSLGARTVVMSPGAHDRILSQVSHLPHLAAVALMATINEDNLKFAASGLRDTTRIAAGEPVMWRDICLTNRKEIVLSIDRYIKNMMKLRAAIRGENSAALMREFARAKRTRDSIDETRHHHRH